MQHLRLDLVSVAFSSQEPIKRALDAITLAIGPGEWVSLVGKNGSGKSTLARVLSGLLPVSAGGIDRGWTAEDGTNRLGVRMVMQQPEGQLIGETVDEDVRFTLELAGVAWEAQEEPLVRALNAVGLLEQQYARTAELSGGQQQLLAVAGCIAAESRLIVFDEATSMLDPLSRERLLECARALQERGVAIVWVTHAMEELAWATRVVAMQEGKLVYDGDVRAFLYGDGSGEETPCGRLQLEPPFAVQTVFELQRRGVTIPGQPLTWEALQAELEVLLP